MHGACKVPIGSFVHILTLPEKKGHQPAKGFITRLFYENTLVIKSLKFYKDTY